MSEERITEEMQNNLLKIVDTLIFADDDKIVGNYKCVNCNQIAIRHNVANCKHIFCSNCSRDLFGETCPACTNVKITEIAKDKKFENRLFDLKVQCPNKKHGCQERIPLHDYQEHERKCKSSTKLLLPKVYQGQTTDDRLTEMESDLHQMSMTIKEIQTEAKQEKFSAKQVISRLNIIDEKIKIMNDNIQKVTCQYQAIPILERLQQIEKELELRKKSEQKVVEEFNNFKKELIGFATRMTNFNSPQTKTELVGEDKVFKIKDQSTVINSEEDPNCIVFQWKITEFQHHYDSFRTSPERLSHSIERETFRHEQIGLKLKLRLYLDWQSVRIYSHSYHNRDNCWHAREFTLVDQSDRVHRKHVTITDTPHFSKNPEQIMQKRCFLNRTLAQMSLLDNKFNTYVREDSILIKLKLIPLTSMYRSVASNNGTLVWTICHYSEKKQDEVNGCSKFSLSPSFYTAPQGYRVHAQVYLDGNGESKGKHISVYVFVAMGEFDHSLPWPINGLVKFSLLDQSEAVDKQPVCQEHQCQFQEGHLHGMQDFVLQSRAEEAKYLEDDTLLLKIEVEI